MARRKRRRSERQEEGRTESALADDDERARIEERAKAVGLSVSTYLRTAGLGHPIKSVLDHAAVMDLAKVNGDKGRLGGLLSCG